MGLSRLLCTSTRSVLGEIQYAGLIEPVTCLIQFPHPIVAKFPFVSGHHHISWSNDNLLWFNLQYPPAIERGLLEKTFSSMIFPARHF